MKPELWQRVEELYHAALKRPAESRAGFLRSACGDDEELYREVESLLALQSKAENFIEKPALEIAAKAVAEDDTHSLTGQRLGNYEVLALLGQGGMGMVYQARDKKLDRLVALKFLPNAITFDEYSKTRFLREAKAASALNHPNVATIYEINETDGLNFIAMEYVEGETLRHLLSRRQVEIKRAAEFAAQIASGLSAAHKVGIAHRDIKPENLIVTNGSQIKILDFGLAKLVEKQRAGAGLSEVTTAYLEKGPRVETKAGIILGTTAYMSPEQAMGQPVDHRTDIFSLGVVLYEMLTSRRPFEGKSAIDTLHAIINQEPPPATELNPQLPGELTDILAKALAKEPAERYQHAGDFELDLRRFKHGLETGSLASAQAQRLVIPIRRTRAAIVWSVIGVLILLTVAAAAWLMGRSKVTNPGWSTARTIATQFTNYGGTEASGALSPDGRSFVFVSEHGGTPDIWLRQIAGGEPVRLTNDAEEERDLVYAPNSETIYFTRIDASGPSIFRIGVLGGQARRIVSNARMPLPSPDGRSIAYFVGESNGGEDAIAVSALDGSGTHTLARGMFGGILITRSAWSPDGRWLSYVRKGLFAPNNLFVVEVSTGTERQVTQFSKSGEGIESQTWLPDNHHLVVSYAPQRSFFQRDLGLLDVQDGSISRLTFNIGQNFSSLSLSADGTRLIATADQVRREVWKVPLGPDPEANGRAAVRVLDSSQDPMWTFVSHDGRMLLFNNATTGTHNLWTMPLDHSSPPRQITTVEGDNVMHSSLSPDGSRVAFASKATGNSNIWTQNVDGSNLRQLTSGQAADFWPVWSPDGKWIVFGSLRGGRYETWRAPSEGGPAEKVLDGFFRGDWIRQPNGKGTWLVSWIDPGGGIRLIDFEARTVVWEEHLGYGAQPLPMFSPDGHFISVARQEGRDRDAIWLYETATGKAHMAVRFREPFKIFFRASWADDGKALVVNRLQTITHIVLFDRFWMKESTP